MRVRHLVVWVCVAALLAAMVMPEIVDFAILVAATFLVSITVSRHRPWSLHLRPLPLPSLSLLCPRSPPVA